MGGLWVVVRWYFVVMINVLSRLFKIPDDSPVYIRCKYETEQFCITNVQRPLHWRLPYVKTITDKDAVSDLSLQYCLRQQENKVLSLSQSTASE